jgi:hypothetical protein
MIKLFENYNNVVEVKEMILLKAIDTDKIEVIDFFINKGYKADNDDIFIKAVYNKDLLEYFLEKGIKPFYPGYYDTRIVRQLSKEEIQRILINFNYAQFIYDTIGFNDDVITEEEVKEVGIDGVKEFVNMKYNMNKFNL